MKNGDTIKLSSCAFRRVVSAAASMSVVAVMMVLSSGCAATMAARQPAKKEVDLFQTGTYRSELMAEFGQPLGTEVSADGKKHEVYKFDQGYSKGTKVARVFTHSVLDLATLFVWEIIGMPIESICDGHEMAYEITYDENNRVASVIQLKRN